MADNELVDNSGWFAFVRYKIDKTTEFVPILSIKEKKIGGGKVLFNPKNLQDFEATKWYSVKTRKGSKDGDAHRYLALIGKLGESQESLELEIANPSKRKRLVWPSNVDNNATEPETTGSEAPLQRDTTNPDILNTQTETLQKKRNKKNMSDQRHLKILSQLSEKGTERSTSPVTGFVGESSQSSVSAEQPASSVSREKAMEKEIERLQALLKERDERLKAAERAKVDASAGEPSSPSPPISTLVDELKKLTNAVQSQQAQIQDLESKLDSFLLTPPQSVTSSSHTNHSASQPPPEERISLSDQFTIAKCYHDSVKDNKLDDHEWCAALLEGVFGEKSHLMRMKLSSKTPGCMRMGKSFLYLAQDLYQTRLTERTVLDPITMERRPYTKTEIQGLVSTLPSYLSDRSYSLYKQKMKTNQSGSAQTRPPQQQSEGDPTPRKRRMYRKRGEVAIVTPSPQEQNPGANIVGNVLGDTDGVEALQPVSDNSSLDIIPLQEALNLVQSGSDEGQMLTTLMPVTP